MTELEKDIMAFIGRRRSAPTTKVIEEQFGAFSASPALRRLVETGKLVCTNGLWVRRDSLMVDNRKPKGPKKLDPKSAEARTLPLEFYK